MLSVRFPELEDTLAQAGSTTEAAEAHGSLCGALCVASPYGVDAWLEELLEESSASDPQWRTVLERVFAETAEALAGGSMAFEALLPDDDQPLADRASALGHWCSGFLYGLGAAREGISLDSLPDEVSEIVQDMREISRAALDTEEPTDTDEQAYAELVEFLRVGVQLVYEELQPLRDAHLPSSQSLH